MNYVYSLKIHQNKELMIKLKNYHEKFLRILKISSNNPDEPQLQLRNTEH